MRVRLESLGCRLNTGEMEALARQLGRRGHCVVQEDEPAELVVLNTCTVTAIASRKSRQLVRRLRSANPGAAVVVTGCYAQVEPDAVRRLGVDLVVGNRDKDRLADLLDEAGVLERTLPIAAPTHPRRPRRTRAFVKIQDGCDHRCAFCIVTVARGGGRSQPGDGVIAEVRDLVEAGYREVVLTGVHLGSYGHDLGQNRGLERLVRRLFEETDLERLRLSSLEPWDLDPGFFDLFEDPRLLPHLHLPLQSGCDATLRRMARRGSSEEFAALVAAARRAIPDLAVSTDVMVGFPGETEDEFERSLAFVRALELARVHAFRFSPRPGTAAATMPDPVPGGVTLARSRRLLELAANLERRFQEAMVGRRMPVLWEASEPDGGALRWSGLTANYVRVVTTAAPDVDLANRVTEALLVHSSPGALVARLV